MTRKPGSMFYPNMNLLRYLLSLGILINHFNVLGEHSVPYFISHDRIGGFFALSGFLMYHSYVRQTGIVSFVKHRARRILPTYIFIVLLCALGGALISDIGIVRYFADPQFWRYLAANLTFLNWLCPSLPGVFTGDAFTTSAINGSLWTMKVEWMLDLSVPLFVWVMHRTRWHKERMAIVLIIVSMLLRYLLLHMYAETGCSIYGILSRQVFTQMGFFYAGMLVYFWRDKVNRYKTQVIMIGLLLYIVGPFVPYGDIVIAPISVPMLVLGISMIGRTIKGFVHVNCISYNIFLVHYPIIQFCVWLGVNNLPVWQSLSIVLAATVLLALFTNRYIDRPFTARNPASSEKPN